MRLAARGLSSLGRSEAKVAATLDALIVTLRRLTGETGVRYASAAVARAGDVRLEAEADGLFGKRPKGAPRVRVMATLPPEAATQPELADNLIAAGHGLRPHQLRPRRCGRLDPHGRQRARGLRPP